MNRPLASLRMVSSKWAMQSACSWFSFGILSTSSDSKRWFNWRSTVAIDVWWHRYNCFELFTLDDPTRTQPNCESRRVSSLNDNLPSRKYSSQCSAPTITSIELYSSLPLASFTFNFGFIVSSRNSCDTLYFIAVLGTIWHMILIQYEFQCERSSNIQIRSQLISPVPTPSITVVVSAVFDFKLCLRTKSAEIIVTSDAGSDRILVNPVFWPHPNLTTAVGSIIIPPLTVAEHDFGAPNCFSLIGSSFVMPKCSDKWCFWLHVLQLR